MQEQIKNLSAPIPLLLHQRIQEEKTQWGLTLGAYVTRVFTEHFEGGRNNMTNTGTRTMAFQIPQELFLRIKEHLERESDRTGKKISQKEFVIGLIEAALTEAEAETEIVTEQEQTEEETEPDVEAEPDEEEEAPVPSES